MASPRDYNKPITPTKSTVELAQAAIHKLGNLPSAGFALVDEEAGIRIELNEQMFETLRSMLIDMAQNRPIVVLPVNHELTTHQTAEALNVSRGFVLALIEKGELPCRKVGTHRRIRLEDVIAYREKNARASDQAVQELTDLEQDMGLD